MTYKEVLDYLYGQLPMYQRIGSAAYKADLKSTWDLMEILDNPHVGLKCIHIAGTNGKGSTAHNLSSILQEQGYKTGLYTSPHFLDFRERVRINGLMIPEEYVTSFVTRYLQKVAEIKPSFFEWTVALAFDYFRKNEVDIAVIETGMGGRLDSTNVVDPLLSVITSIGMDHMQFLGNDLISIAREKAGIIKHGRPVVCGIVSDEVKSVFIEKAETTRSEITFIDERYRLVDYLERNRALSVLAAVHLRNMGYHISDESIQKGLEKVYRNTGWRGRWEQVAEQPKVVMDMAHNEDGLKEVCQKLSEESYLRLHIVYGAVNDKDVDKIIPILPADAIFYLCAANIPRSMPVDVLREKFAQNSIMSAAFETVEEAVRKAMQVADNQDFILITGSTFVVAEAMQLF